MEQTESPIIIPPKEKKYLPMDFPWAMRQVIFGNKVKRIEWEEGYYGVMADGFLMLHKPDGKHYQWLVSEGDLIAVGWIYVK